MGYAMRPVGTVCSPGYTGVACDESKPTHSLCHKQMKNPVDSKKEKYVSSNIMCMYPVTSAFTVDSNAMPQMFVRQARDGVRSTNHDLADCETLRNSLFTL